MRIIRRKSFVKAYANLSLCRRKQVDIALQLFARNPLDVKLHNHPLKGNMKGLRSFSAAHDVRIIFKEEQGYIVVILVSVGTHNQVYKS